MKYTKENAYKHLRESIEHFGRFPTVQMYTNWARKNKKINHVTVTKLTNKKWSELESELGAHRDKRAREDLVIYHLQQAAQIYGDSISKREYIEYSQTNKKEIPSIINLSNIFSTFNKAKLAAGLSVNRGFSTEKITKEQCIKALQDCARDLGSKFTEPQYLKWVKEKRKEGKYYPNPSTIRKRFGKFSSSLNEAGLKTIYEIDEQDVYEHACSFLRDKITFKKYEEWAKENNKLHWENFSKLGYDFRETLLNTLELYLKRRK